MITESSDQKTIGLMIQKHVVEPLMHGTFHLSEMALMGIVVAICHIEKNIDQTCRLCNNCDPKTLKRWENDPELGFPQHHKDSGGKQYYFLDEVIMWKMKHPEIIGRVEQKKKKF